MDINVKNLSKEINDFNKELKHLNAKLLALRWLLRELEDNS